jgi:hypothetical protein
MTTGELCPTKITSVLGYMIASVSHPVQGAHPGRSKSLKPDETLLLGPERDHTGEHSAGHTQGGLLHGQRAGSRAGIIV